MALHKTDTRPSVALRNLWLACWLAQARAISVDKSDSMLFKTEIVNGAIIQRPSETHSFFALPTAEKGGKRWLGCGASIISTEHAISSAHCFGGGLDPCAGPREVSLYVGDVTLKNGQIEHIPGGKSKRLDATVRCHPSWDGKCSHGYDVAIMDLATTPPEWVHPLPLMLEKSASVGSSLIILGYGDMEASKSPLTIGGPSPFLRQAQVSLWDAQIESCSKVFAGGFGCSDKASEAAGARPEMQFCAGNEQRVDTCSGDSGSPVLAQQTLDQGGSRLVQVGIVSYGGGPNTTSTNECGDPAWPGMYASIFGLKSVICGAGGISGLPECGQELVKKEAPNKSPKEAPNVQNVQAQKPTSNSQLQRRAPHGKLVRREKETSNIEEGEHRHSVGELEEHADRRHVEHHRHDRPLRRTQAQGVSQ